MSHVHDQAKPCWNCNSKGVHGDSDSAGTEVWCGCIFSYCGALAFMDAGRGDETFVCRLRPGHEGHEGADHNESGVTWAVSERSPLRKKLP